jgi:hypothetical protein
LKIFAIGEECIPQGLKPRFFAGLEIAKAEALAYLEAKTSKLSGYF